MRVLTVGDVFVDCVMSGLTRMPRLGEEIYGDDFALAVGGDPALYAVNLARLGLETSVVAQLGEDFFSDFVIRNLTQEGVDTRFVMRSAKSRANITFALSLPQDRAFATFLGAEGQYTNEVLPWGDLGESEALVLFGTRLEQKGPILKQAKSRGMLTVLNAGWDPSEQWSEALYDLGPQVDVFIANEVEVRHLTRQADHRTAMRELSRRFSVCVATLGGEGALASDGEEMIHCPAFPMPVVDTTGAGAAFGSGFLYGLLHAWSLADCVTLGNACGGLAITAIGGSTAFPTLSQLQEFLRVQGMARHPIFTAMDGTGCSQ
jgi:sugar/nucleoside kinase (ribokinase family)